MAWIRSHLSRADERRLVASVGEAERGHRGEVRLHLERRYEGDGPRARAAELFDELGMAATRDGTGVLLYIAVDDRKVAVHAGPGIYGAAEPEFWRGVTDAVADGFRRGEVLGGLLAALERVAAVLREHAPGEDTAGDELTNALSVR